MTHLAPVDFRHMGVELTPAEAALAESSPAVLHAPTYDALFRLGIHGKALTGADAFDALHVEAVCFLGNERFEFARDMSEPCESGLAVIIPCRNELGRTVDLVAWEIETRKLAVWRGEAAMLGEDQIDAPRIEYDGVRIYPGPVDWLHAGRRGAVILDALRARWRLAEDRLIVNDADFGRRLRRMLRLPEPRVFVDVGTAAA
jgi:hypothetical protein